MDRALLIAKLGLPKDASDDDIQAKLDEIVVNAAKKPEQVEVVAKGVIEALELKEGDDVTTVVANIHALKQAGKTAVDPVKFAAMEKQLQDRDVNEVVAKAITDGKITPDQKEWAEGYARESLEGFKTFVAKAPVVVPVGKLPEQKAEVDGAEPDAVTMEIAKSMGLDAEDIKKYGGE